MKRSLFGTKLTLVTLLVIVTALVDGATADPDLSVLSVSVENRPASDTYYPGDSVNVIAEVINAGDQTADGFTADVYAGNYFLGSESLGSLEPGVSTLFWVFGSLPDDIPPGHYSIQMDIYCSNDGNSGNDSGSDASGVTVIAKPPPAPDLWLEGVWIRNIHSIYYPGDSVPIDCSVRNVGDSTSDSYTAYVSAGDYSLGSGSGGAVEAGEISSILIPCSLPEDMAEGVYSVSVEIYCSNDVNTSNNSNSANGNLRVAKKGPADVVVRSIDAPDGMYRPGDPIVVNVSVEAVGGQLVSSCDIDLYASTDTTISAGDYLIHESNISSMEPGSSVSIDFPCQFPSGMPLGSYYIGVILTQSTLDGTETATAYDTVPVYVGNPCELVVESVDAEDGEYLAGGEIHVYSLIKNVGQYPSDRYTVDFYVSSDTTITTEDDLIGYVDREGLAAGHQHSFDTTCQLPATIDRGAYYIGLIVTCINDDVKSNNTGHDVVPIELVYPAGTVCGQIRYQDRDGGEHPVRYSRVEVYEADGNTNSLDDLLLGQTYTDDSGNYGLALDGGKGDGDVYIRIYAEGVSGACAGTTSTICRVSDDLFHEVYTLQSALYPHPGDSFVIIDVTAPNTGGEFMVYDAVVEGFDKAYAFMGIEMPELAVYWPTSDDMTYYDPGAGIFVCQGDRGDRDVILHEYGHYVAEEYQFAQGDVGENPTHFWNLDLRRYPVWRDSDEARNLAFRESWASLFGIAMQYGNTDYPNSGDAKYQDVDEETDEVFEVDLEGGEDPWCKPGEFYENMNCCALWDIFDDRVDGYLDLISDPSLTNTWNVMCSYRPDDIIDFWNGWCLSCGYDSKIRYIFRAHNLPYGLPPEPERENRPPVADAGEDQTVYQTYAGGAVVSLNGSGSDEDGDNLTYEWQTPGGRRTKASTSAEFPVGESTATLTVSDGEFSDSDSITVTVIATDPGSWTAGN
jgi:hypothetical protein